MTVVAKRLHTVEEYYFSKKLKAVRALVANEPELSSQVVKAWLSEDD